MSRKFSKSILLSQGFLNYFSTLFLLNELYMGHDYIHFLYKKGLVAFFLFGIMSLLMLAATFLADFLSSRIKNKEKLPYLALLLSVISACTANILILNYASKILCATLLLITMFFYSICSCYFYRKWTIEQGNAGGRGKFHGIKMFSSGLALIVFILPFLFKNRIEIPWLFNINPTLQYFEHPHTATSTKNFFTDSENFFFLAQTLLLIILFIYGIYGLIKAKNNPEASDLEDKADIFHFFKPSVVKSNKILYLELFTSSLNNLIILNCYNYYIVHHALNRGSVPMLLVSLLYIIAGTLLAMHFGMFSDMLGYRKPLTLASILILLVPPLTLLIYFKSDFFPGYFALLILFCILGNTKTIITSHSEYNLDLKNINHAPQLFFFFEWFLPMLFNSLIGIFWALKFKKIYNFYGKYTQVYELVIPVLLIGISHIIMAMQEKVHYSLSTGEAVEDKPFTEYPRPQLQRASYLSLNGKWDCGIKVPFPLQSELSGHKGKVFNHYTYYTTVTIPENFIKNPEKDLLFLHFDAVDQVCRIYIDNKLVMRHEGGYMPFYAEISKYLQADQKSFKLKVKIKDTLSHKYPYGKQTKHRGGMWYTPVSGIWKSVWLESVNPGFIENLKITPAMESIKIQLTSGSKNFKVQIFLPEICTSPYWNKDHTLLLEKAFSISSEADRQFSHDFTINIPEPVNWTPETPYLYGLKIITEADEIKSYFALRTLRISNISGKERLLLNDKPYFFTGVLDQGYWPEGIFLPANAKGYEQDILRMKELGFNTLRKHIKIEPELFYEACDRLGMIVFQDMVNNLDYNLLRDGLYIHIGIKYLNDRKVHKNKKAKQIWREHMINTINSLYNHPCICYWTLFNEGWGQFESDAMYGKAKELDDTRFIDSTSGWFHQKLSDVESRHVYFRPIEQWEYEKPIIMSEFGGYSLKEKDHFYTKYGNYGYGDVQNHQQLTEAVKKLYEEQIIPYVKKGLCAAIYTQLSDVEDETNGFYTYDRKVCKVDKETMLQLRKKLDKEIQDIQE